MPAVNLELMRQAMLEVTAGRTNLILYWSMTAYDRQTHAFIREVAATSRSSQTPGLRVNRDGSVDLWPGPTAPVSDRRGRGRVAV